MIDLLIPKFDGRFPASAVMNMWRKVQGARPGATIYAFLHDDVEFPSTCDGAWLQVQAFFDDHPKCGMIGFGGALGLGTNDIYKRPYNLLQLARIGFISNMRDAEKHGTRVTEPAQISVLDGFCQIIRRTAYEEVGGWESVMDLGIEYHMYDAAMACLMAEKGWEVWMLPVPCHHAGGKTSTTPAYDAWLRSRGINGDGEIHAKAHRIIYDRFRDVLPLRVR